MTYVTFLSSLLIVFGPPLALYILVIAQSSQLIILSIGSAFFWILSIMVSSILWFVVIPLRSIPVFIIPFAVIFQELVRFGFWKLLDKAYNGPWKDEPSRPPTFMASMAIGWGIGVTMALVMQTSILSNALGPGDLAAPACPQVSLFHIHALITLAMLLLHITLSIIAFDGYSRKSWLLILYTYIAHATLSFATLWNQTGGSCIGSVLLSYGVLGISVIVAWRLALSESNSLLRYQKNR